MLVRLLLIFTLIPLAEIYFLIFLGKAVGLWPTLIMVASTGFVGVYLLRAQGFVILSQIRQQLNYGQIPGNEVLDGLLILIGGAFLLTPGLITDTLGFVLLLPPSRRVLREALKRWLRKQIDTGRMQFYIRF